MPTATKDAEISLHERRAEATEPRRVYDRWGLSLSEAFNLFMRKSVEVGGLPFDLRPEPSPALSGRETLRPNPATGITVLPAWMDAPEDEGLYDDLV